MKIYDKEMYNREQSMKSVILVIVVFLVGFFTGYLLKGVVETPVQEETSQNVIVNGDNVNNIK